MGTLILVRHSLTGASESGRNLGQRSDPPLVPEGVELAERLATALATEAESLPHRELRVLSSPARRCLQTTAPITTALGFGGDSEVRGELREIDYGAWEGLTAAECRERDPALRAAWEADPYTTRCPDGESGADVAARFSPAMEAVEHWLGADRARLAVVVSHNHVIRLRLAFLLGLPAREYRDRVRADPGGYSVVTLTSGRIVVRRMNAAVPPSPASAAPPRPATLPSPGSTN
jgi:ribonuclease H / adenosylcobalamin/alpha-ribazole phosphatase